MPTLFISTALLEPDNIQEISLVISIAFSMIRPVWCWQDPLLEHLRNGKSGISDAGIGLMNIGSQGVPRNEETALDQLLRSLEGAVFMFNTNHVIVADRVQGADELVPLYLAEAR
jgi:hypothetical protein